MLLDERDPQGWVLKALREAGSSLLTELHGLEEDALSRRPSEGEWCLKEIAAHLRDAEELALAQITSILEHPRSAVPTWDIDLLPLERDYRSGDLRLFLTELRGLRRQNMQLLWGLTEADWHLAAQHAYQGEISPGQIARELAQHDLEHLWQVRRLKQALGAVAARADDDWW